MTSGSRLASGHPSSDLRPSGLFKCGRDAERRTTVRHDRSAAGSSETGLMSPFDQPRRIALSRSFVNETTSEFIQIQNLTPWRERR
jgi:hypothetical protein